jgi:mono/diheme cytochrome c family protein
VALSCGAILLMAGMAGLQAAPGGMTGIYTADQATRGAVVFKDNCAVCHGDNVQGRRSDGGAPLKGLQFTSKWGGQSLYALFSVMEELMPARHPSSLTKAQYADVVSYLFQVNGMPPGPKPMPLGPTEQKKLLVLFPK